MKILRRRRTPPAIDMSPMIDCVFQLLIFFMLSSSFMTPMIRIVLPRATASDDAPGDTVIVSVNEEGLIFVNTRQVTLETLTAELRPMIAKLPIKNITFRGDAKVHLERFVQVLSAAKNAGAVNVDIAHRGKN